MPELRTEDIDNQEIFATGRWNNDEYSEADLDAMIEAYSKVGFKPPIKLGHSDAQKLLKDAGLPAAGWVENLRRNGSKLIADFKKVPGIIADLIRAGGLRKKSAEIYWEYLDEKNQMKLPRVLKAVSLLGTEIPAVTSLEDIMALYEKLPDGPVHAFKDNGNEFRLYHMDMLSPGPAMSSFDAARFLIGLRRKAKADVNFSDLADQCVDCRYYLEDMSACTLVEGYIEDDDGCDLFEANTENYASRQKIKEYTIEKRGNEWCLLIKDGSKILGCHKTEAEAQAQERAVQANKNSQEEDNMPFKVHMTREEISNICLPCGEKMAEKGISALTFTTEQVAKFAAMDMKTCMADAKMVKDYPAEAERTTACQDQMGKAMMDVIQETKGGPNMDEKKFEQEKAQLKADKEKAEEQVKEYQDKLATLEAANKEAEGKESEALQEVKKLKRERHDDQIKSWISAQKRAGKLAPVEESRLTAIFSALYEDRRVVTFAQADGKEAKEPLADAIKSFIVGRPSIFKELSFAMPEPGESMDKPGDELNRLTLEYQKKNSVKEYNVAFKAVQKDNPELTQQWLALQQ